MFGITQDGTYRAENIGFSTPELTTGYVVGVRSVQHELDVLPGEDGTVYWDVVEVFEDQWDAVLLADTRGELAIWDAAAGQAISIDRVTVSDAWDAMMVADGIAE
jgi:hypothetical protein